MTNQYICSQCPRNCSAVRNSDRGSGFCQMPSTIMICRSALHFWEEPPISGTKGSGTIFFAGCVLRCRYCQNIDISRNPCGISATPNELAQKFKELQEMGAHNINLVTPTHYAEQIMEALDIFRPSIPVVYNCGGYEKPEMLEKLSDYVDIWLTDLKYGSNEKGQKYSGVKDYFDVVTNAILKMKQLCPEDKFDENGIMQKGVIIRHLILPGNTKSSIAAIDWIAQNLPKNTLVSLMSQYTPNGDISDFPELNRKITKRELDKVSEHMLDVGLDSGFMQDITSSGKKYIPEFTV